MNPFNPSEALKFHAAKAILELPEAMSLQEIRAIAEGKPLAPRHRQIIESPGQSALISFFLFLSAYFVYEHDKLDDDVRYLSMISFVSIGLLKSLEFILKENPIQASLEHHHHQKKQSAIRDRILDILDENKLRDISVSHAIAVQYLQNRLSETEKHAGTARLMDAFLLDYHRMTRAVKQYFASVPLAEVTIYTLLKSYYGHDEN